MRRAFVRDLCEEARYYRFMTRLNDLPEAMAERFTSIEYIGHLALVAEVTRADLRAHVPAVERCGRIADAARLQVHVTDHRNRIPAQPQLTESAAMKDLQDAARFHEPIARQAQFIDAARVAFAVQDWQRQP